MRKRGRPRKAKLSVPSAAKAARIDVKLSPTEVARVEALVREGVFMTKADFARTAIREKPSAL